MKSVIDCIPCMVDHTLHVARMVTDSEARRREIIKAVLAQVAGIDFESTPPEMARTIHGIIREMTGVDDPYQGLKDQSTEMAAKLLPMLREIVDRSEDRFDTIVRLVIAGNIIDFGADRNFNLKTVQDRIMEVLNMPLDRAAVAALQTAMAKSRRILYLLDNCGEAVIDRLLIEPYREKITVAVRGGAILNDITRREVEASGLAGLTTIIDSGDRTPGTALRYVSPEFRRCFESADLIIAKGQGNYETLSDIDRPIFFLLRVKCIQVAQHLNQAPLGSLQVVHANI